MRRGCIASAVPKSVQFSTPSGPSLQAHNHRKYKGLWLKKQLAAEHGHTFTLLQDLLGCGVVVRQGVAGIAVLHRKTGQPVSRPERHQHSHCEASQEYGKHFSSPTTATNTLSRLFPYLLPSFMPEGTCNLPGWPNLRVFLRCQTSPTPRSVLAAGQFLLRTWPSTLYCQFCGESHPILFAVFADRLIAALWWLQNLATLQSMVTAQQLRPWGADFSPRDTPVLF